MRRAIKRRHPPRMLGRPQSFAVLLALLACCFSSIAQENPSGSRIAQDADKLIAEQRWQDVVQLLAPLHARTADMDFDYGTALAHLQLWGAAGSAFFEGSRLAPGDPRFLVEGAGAEFKQKHYAEATRLLQRALRLAPHDSYTSDFLGTVYFLEGNLEAALKYWNRVGKPAIDVIRKEPPPQVSPVLLDRAFAFSPAATLHVNDLRDTRARIRGM